MANQIIAVAASTQTELEKSPFLAQNPTNYHSEAGTTVYGVFLAARNARNGDYQRWEGDGTTNVWDQDTIVNLANAHDDGGALAVADTLRVVLKVNGEVWQRVDSGGPAPSGKEFSCADSGGKITITTGDTPVEGAKVEVFLRSAMDATLTLAAGVHQEAPAYQVVLGTAAFEVIRLTR